MELFSESLLEKWQQTITWDYLKSHGANAWLFHDREEYHNFIFGCVGVGIAKGIKEKEKFDESNGSFYFFCSLKAFEFIRDELRREHRRRQAESQTVLKDLVLLRPQVVDDTQEVDLRDQRERWIKDLSEDQRDVLLLVDFIGCPAKEAAQILKRRVDAVYSLLKRARRKMAQAHEAWSSEKVSGPRTYRGARKPRDGLSDT